MQNWEISLKKTKSFEECGLLIQKIEIKVFENLNVEISDFPGSLFGNILKGKEVKAMKQGR